MTAAIATVKYTDQELRREIHVLLDGLAVRREPWLPQIVAIAICDGHREALAADSDSVHVAFWEFTGYTIARKFSTECINERADPRYDTDNENGGPPVQIELPDFERELLQDYYVVSRGKEAIGVCVLDMTDDEIYAKARLYRRQSVKAIVHAAELERFVDWRHAREAR